MSINNEYKFTGLPSFSLSPLRRKYRAKFINMVNKNEIEFENVDECLCGKGSLEVLAEQDRFGLPFKTLACTDCGLMATSPRMLGESMALYYDQIYHPLVVGLPLGETEKDIVTEKLGEDIYRYIRSEVQVSHGMGLSLFELGCANGGNLLSIRDMAKKDEIECKLYGAEFETHNVETAKANNIRMFQGGIEKPIEANLKFDIVIMSHVLEHLNDIQGTLKATKELLNPDGLLYIEVPGLMSPTFMQQNYRNDFLDYLVHAHTYHFNIKSIEYTLSLNGFEMIKGDEKVRGLFRPVERVDLPVPSKNYMALKEYIDGLVNKKEAKSAQSIFRIIKIALINIYYRFCLSRMKL